MATRILYLNHAGTSWPKPRVVTDAVREAMDAPPSEWPLRFNRAHQAVAEFFGVSRPEQILLTPGCTSALTVAVSDALVAPGKRVLTTHWEHHALHRPLLKLAAVGTPVEYIPQGGCDSATGLLDLDWLAGALHEGDVGLVAMTAACNVTGDLLPYQEVTRLARSHGVPVLIDAAQVVGWLRLDLSRLGADLVAFGGHKGLQAPWGVGGLYLSQRIQMQCVTASCQLPTEGESREDLGARPGYCDVGSVDQWALAGLHAAIQMLSGKDFDARLAHARAQTQRIREALQTIGRVRLYGNERSSARMPSLAFSVDNASSDEVAALLQRQALVVGSGLQCALLAHDALGTEATGLVRLSVGLGQPDDEIEESIDRLLAAL